MCGEMWFHLSATHSGAPRDLESGPQELRVEGLGEGVPVNSVLLERAAGTLTLSRMGGEICMRSPFIISLDRLFGITMALVRPSKGERAGRTEKDFELAHVLTY